jgi:hypothetical protein
MIAKLWRSGRVPWSTTATPKMPRPGKPTDAIKPSYRFTGPRYLSNQASVSLFLDPMSIIGKIVYYAIDTETN